MQSVSHHMIQPVYDERSEILILGTMPSPKSREAGFYYAHPQNRFWRVLADVFGEDVPQGTQDRRAFALRHRIALWDVLAQCDIEGAQDQTIRNPVPNDIGRILRAAPVQAVFTTGAAAAKLYKRYCLPQTGREAIALPSTSSANCRMPYETLLQAYRVILRHPG